MWLSLTEYSNKHSVSISTLRRKIKSTEVEFRLDEGKYMILDSDQDVMYSEKNSTVQRSVISNENYRPSLKSDKNSLNETKTAESGESVITAANRLLADLKKAYTQVLQDKEEHISDLKEENSDLKTLIKVLESENDRLRGH
jgi:hypothetical protein